MSYLLTKSNNYLNQKGLISLNYSFTHPYLTCCKQIWDCLYENNLRGLSILQNKGTRIMFHVKPRECADYLYTKLAVMKFTNINPFQGRFMHRYCNGKVPENFGSYFRQNCDVHRYDTNTAQRVSIAPFAIR